DTPAITVERTGDGAGRREFVEQPNLLRLFVGQAHGPQPAGFENDRIWVLETNLDDLPAEVIGYCYDLLLSAGALDVFTTPVFMKKNRPGVLLSVLAPAAAIPAVEAILFRETTTLAVPRYQASRHKLHREPRTGQTASGPLKAQ